ncbi:MAG: HAMP domain-containing sensor histidine kinase [Anaerolineales bacterium]|jgi:signal transduction histidine kinase
MSLRARLTFLYTSLLGGVLLVFGVVIYQLVSVILIRQVDATLAETAGDLVSVTRMNTQGELYILPSPSIDLGTNVYFQLWERNRVLGEVSPNIRRLTDPLDSRGLQSTQPIFRDSVIESAHLRVLSVPLTIGDRVIGTLQVGTGLSVVDAVRGTLLTVLVVGSVAAMTITALAVSLTTYRALNPLESVTETALQITRADDLSRRIPYQGPAEDEIGQLINAFNQTLGRLENLFHTQRRFVADVGHELRTPLTVIKGNVDLLHRMGTADDEALSSIENEVDRLTRMVGDLLLLAQAESGKIPLDNRLVELDTLVLEVLQQTRVLARDRIDLRLGDIDQVLVCGDRDRLKQVLLNLVGNALKYTPAGGEVVVGLGKVADRARLTVSDTGPGIPPEELPYIFERFYRIEKSRTRSSDGKGFGLGLSIAYWIVRNHGGQIDVDSRDGQGTTFCVWLPLAVGDCQPLS